MIATIGKWIVSVACAAMLSGAALAITPPGRVHRVLRLVCGAVMVIVLVSPLKALDIGQISLNTAEYRQEMEKIQNAMTETSENLSRTIIEDKCAAYILDKAQVFGIALRTVSVTAKRGDDGYYYPYETNITLTSEYEEKGALSGAIQSELGIPPERQYWNGNEE